MTKAIVSFTEKNKMEIRYGVVNLETNEIVQINSPFDPQIIDTKAINLSNVNLLPPVVPTKIIAVGLNYVDHAEEFKQELPSEPLLFLKAPSALLAHNESIVLPKVSERVDYEAELVVVIKEPAKNISEKDAIDYILGYCCGNDVTARDLQKKDVQWTRAKSFDTFAPIGPWIIPAKNIDPTILNITAIKNGTDVQLSNTANMVFNVYKLVSYISHIMTLLPGDLIMTGTPAGVGPLKVGDQIEIEIENIGILKNYVSEI